MKETYILEKGEGGIGCAFYCFADERLPDERHLTLSRLQMFVKLCRERGNEMRIEREVYRRTV
jgi:hypothetical protein